MYAIPKDNGGFEMMYSEIHQHRISFTSLEAFKVRVRQKIESVIDILSCCLY